MKHNLRKNARVTSFLQKALKPLFAICALAPIFGQHHAHAQLFWDQGGNGGTGNWNHSTVNWSNVAPPTAAIVPWTDNNVAVFSGIGGTVTINDDVNPIIATGLTFAANGYNITDDGAGGLLQMDGATTITVNPTISATITTSINSVFSASTLTINGGGTLTIAGFNAGTYFGKSISITGGTTVKAAVNAGVGTGDFAIPQNSAISLTLNSTLDVNGTNQTIASLTGTPGSIVTNTSATYGTISIGSNAVANTTFGGNITDTAAAVETTANLTPAGGLGVTVVGPAGGYTLTLTGTNTYHGITTVGSTATGNPATLQAGATNTLSPNSVIDVKANAKVDLNGFSQIVAALNGTGTGTITNAKPNTTAILTFGNASLTGTLSSSANLVDVSTVAGAGSLAVTKNGAYTQVFAGNNTYGGATIVNLGTLANGSATGFSANSTYTINATGIIDVNGFNANFGSLSSASATASLTNGSGTVTGPHAGASIVTIGANDVSTTFAGTIKDGTSTLAIKKTGLGNLTLTNAGNTYSQGTTLDAGGIFADANTALSTGAINITSPAGTAVLGSHVDGTSLANPLNVTGDFHVAPATTGALSLVLTGTVNLNGATRTITGDTAGGTTHLSGVISNGGVTFQGTSPGSIFLYDGTAANTYTGTTTVGANALLRLNDTAANGAVVGPLTVSTGGAVDLAGSDQISDSAAVTVDSTGLTVNGSKYQGLDLHNQKETIASLSGSGTVGLGSGTLTVSSGTFAGNILDGSFGSKGNLVKTSAGILTLSGTNTYTGTTSVDAGTLKAGSTGGLSSASAFTVAAPGTLDINGFNSIVASLAGAGKVTNGSATAAILSLGTANTSTAFTGTIQDGAGALGLTKVGTGTFTVSNSTYSGATNILGGTLRAASITGFSSRSALTVTSPGVADLNGFSNSIGSLAGTGIVTNLGAAAAVLTTGFDNTDTTFSGIIQDGKGSTALIKTGTGSTTLGGGNTFTGGTILQGGALVIANSLALGNGNVNVNGGALKASGAPIAIRVAGNYTQSSAGELDLRIGGTTAGSFDRLSVVGHASLAGRLNVSTVNGFAPKFGDKIAVVNAGAGVSGTFDKVLGSLTTVPLLAATVNYLPGEVDILFGQNPTPSVTPENGFFAFANLEDLTPNQKAVAFALDHMRVNNDAAKLLINLTSRSLNDIPAALDHIAPEEYGTMYQISVSAAKMQAVTVENRLDEVHATVAPTGANGPAGPADGKGSKELMPPPEYRLSVFANGSGEFTSVGNTSNAAGYNFDSGGVTIGADYRFGEHFVAGALFNYTRTRADLVDNGRIDNDAFRGGLYASLFGGGAYVNGFVGGGYNNYDMRRSGVDATVRGATSGGEFNALITTGYDLHAGNLTYGPVGSFQYTYTGTDSFNESGSLDPLHIHSGKGESLRTNFGLRAAYEWHIGSMVLVPEVRATWQHEYGDTIEQVTADMLLGSPNFTVNSAAIGRDSLVLNAGFTLRISPQFSAYAFYDGELARTNYQANNVLVGLRASF